MGYNKSCYKWAFYGQETLPFWFVIPWNGVIYKYKSTTFFFGTYIWHYSPSLFTPYLSKLGFINIEYLMIFCIDEIDNHIDFEVVIGSYN